MRTFYIALAVFIVLIAWMLNKPIPKREQVAHAFSGAEVDYIEKSFDYAMETLKGGEHFDWSTANVNGRISAGESFMSNRKADCRNYVEIMRTAEDQRTEGGIACKRSNGEGWCRIAYNTPQSCALEKQEDAAIKAARYSIMRGIQAADSALGTNVSVSTDGLVPGAPSYSGGSGPSIGAPSYEKPKIDHTIRPPILWEEKNSK